VAEACYIEQSVQKARKVAKAKVWKKAEKRKHVKKKEKRKWLEYLKKLWDKVLAEDIILIAGTENSQIVGAKYKDIVKIFLENEVEL